MKNIIKRILMVFLAVTLIVSNVSGTFASSETPLSTGSPAPMQETATDILSV